MGIRFIRGQAITPKGLKESLRTWKNRQPFIMLGMKVAESFSVSLSFKNNSYQAGRTPLELQNNSLNVNSQDYIIYGNKGDTRHIRRRQYSLPPAIYTFGYTKVKTVILRHTPSSFIQKEE